MMESATPLYDRIGIGYDTTRRADPFLAGRLHDHLRFDPDGSYLDLACGTGNYTVALARRGGRWSGVDGSATMIAAAAEKSSEIAWHIADVTSLPMSDGAFDGAMCILAVHHFPDVPAAFAEVRRVLRRGSGFVLFTSDPEQMRGYWLNAYFPQAMQRSIEVMPTVESLEETMRDAGIETIARVPYSVQPDLQDFFLYSGKFDPARYLDPRLRAGISTFAVFAEAGEIERGCARLAGDIASGRIAEVTAGYVDACGDYLFLIGEAV